MKMAPAAHDAQGDYGSVECQRSPARCSERGTNFQAYSAAHRRRRIASSACCSRDHRHRGMLRGSSCAPSNSTATTYASASYHLIAHRRRRRRRRRIRFLRHQPACRRSSWRRHYFRSTQPCPHCMLRRPHHPSWPRFRHRRAFHRMTMPSKLDALLLVAQCSMGGTSAAGGAAGDPERRDHWLHYRHHRCLVHDRGHGGLADHRLQHRRRRRRMNATKTTTTTTERIPRLLPKRYGPHHRCPLDHRQCPARRLSRHCSTRHGTVDPARDHGHAPCRPPNRCSRHACLRGGRWHHRTRCCR